MPLGSKRSRAAKQAYQNAHAIFTMPALHTASPSGSEYLSLDDSEESGKDLDIQVMI
jgi:hypothetical protein